MSANLQSRPEMDCTPLLHWDDKALAYLADKVVRVISQWRADWAPAAAVTADPGGSVQAMAWVGGLHDAAWLAFRLHAAAPPDAAGAWLVCEKVSDGAAIAQADRLVGRQVIGNGAAVDPHSLAAEFCREALAHLVSALRTALAIDGGATAGFDPSSAADTLPPEAFRAWSGGVRVPMPGFDDLALYLAGPTVARMNPPRRSPTSAGKVPLTVLTAAAVRTSVPVTAQLHPVELTLGQIRSLQVGDVVVLPHALEQPLRVVPGHGAVLCEAYLGRSGSHRSLELLRHGEGPAGM